MTTIFFKNGIDQVIKLIESIENSTAFWYSPGLLSYEYLDDALVITELQIEESIFNDFKKDYPRLIAKYPHSTFKGTNTSAPVAPSKIALYASSDTIVKSYKPLLGSLNIDSDVYCSPIENALPAAQKLGIKATVAKHSISPRNYSLLVVANDWGFRERKFSLDFMKNGKNAVCIQESSIDLRPVDGRMRTCSFPIFQGTATLENISVKNKISAVIGNPRFEDLKPAPAPDYEKALINVNFTYGIFEEVRNSWVKDIVDVCTDLNIDYLLSQHPRDAGVFENYKVEKSNPLSVHDSIRNSSVLISRFSALLTEAICLGRPSIYYNPHGENMGYKFEADNKMFFVAKNKEELLTALQTIRELKTSNTTVDSQFLFKHLGNTTAGKASKYIGQALKDVAGFPLLKKVTFYDRMIASLKLYKRTYIKA
ncbi:hypothetical protein [Mucilaginibacter rubeus]|uniref:Uncharacterized protein n=1 Tax=Mucilaginibacter rubeus TaxID=2027860 RepID=A0A5C1I2H1_9SPHI|nr:hypothetical protein [Mucilaginibacter rubeus]QEM11996.1 hypothetical protein DEO27_018810 [Mucilaginibacter rubeus]